MQLVTIHKEEQDDEDDVIDIHIYIIWLHAYIILFLLSYHVHILIFMSIALHNEDRREKENVNDVLTLKKVNITISVRKILFLFLQNILVDKGQYYFILNSFV